MKLLAILAALSLATLAARADWVMKLKIEGSIQNADTIVRVKDAKTRADVGATFSTIGDSASGSVITLLHDKKHVVRISASETKAMIDQLKALQPPDLAAPAKPASTDKREKIGDWDAEVFTWKSPLVEGRFWVAKDFPEWQRLGPAMDKLQLGGFGQLAQGLVPKAADFPGMIVKQELTVFGNKLISTLVSVKEEPVDAATFDVPAGYTEAEKPALTLPPPGKEK